jgi:MFS family permease
MDPPLTSRASFRPVEFLALERSVVAAAAAMFVMGLGEELWKRFIPKYLEALGAPIAAIGAYGTVRDLADGLFQYPGGWIADRYGRRRALRLFVLLAAVGYAIYFVAPAWPFVFVGLCFVMAWSSAASPTLFAIVGDALPRHQRTMGFTVQSILRRVPIIIAPSIGGVWIATHGIRGGVRLGLVVALVLAMVTLAITARVQIPAMAQPRSERIGVVWRELPGALRRLLGSDILVRMCEGLADVFIVLYAIDVVGITAPQFGLLVAVQMATAIIVYVPAATFVRTVGRKPFVIATFLAFALFPIAVVFATGLTSLAVAFVIGGLREIGEPARKAMIVDLAVPHRRARTVGMYYLIRGLAVSPAAAIGGMLWTVHVTLPFVVAGLFGVAGAIVFAVTVPREESSQESA